MKKYTYKLECLVGEKWCKFKEGDLRYLEGYIDSHKDSSPRCALQIIRSDGRIIESVAAREDVSVGMIAGWPTPEQYEAAAQRALDKAKALREMKLYRPLA